MKTSGTFQSESEATIPSSSCRTATCVRRRVAISRSLTFEAKSSQATYSTKEIVQFELIPKEDTKGSSP
jgi:hypothetical protein